MGDNSWMMQPFPTGWEQKYDPRINRYYFVNHQTRATQWEDPRKAFYAVHSQTSQPAAPPQKTKKERLVEAFKNNLTSDMAETWDDAEINTFIGELLETSGNDFNLVMKEIDKLKGDMGKSASEVEEDVEEEDLFDPEEMKRIQEEARREAEQRKIEERDRRTREAKMERQAEIDRENKLQRDRKEREERERKKKAELAERKRKTAENAKRMEEEMKLIEIERQREQMNKDSAKMSATFQNKKKPERPPVTPKPARTKEPRKQTKFVPVKFVHKTAAIGRNPQLASGPNQATASGSNPSYRCGPNRNYYVGSSGAVGADPTLRQNFTPLVSNF